MMATAIIVGKAVITIMQRMDFVRIAAPFETRSYFRSGKGSFDLNSALPLRASFAVQCARQILDFGCANLRSCLCD
jgi:hypothetical protein